MTASTSLRSQWLKLSILIITITYLLFSSLLIYATSVYLKDQEYRSVSRSLSDVSSLYENQPFNSISEREIYTSLYDNQQMGLYTLSGEEVYRWPVRSTLDIDTDFEATVNPVIERRSIDGEDHLVGTRMLQSDYWHGYVTVVHPLNEYNTIIRMMLFIATIIGFLSITFTSIISYFFSIQMVKPIGKFTGQLKKNENQGFAERLDLKTNIVETDYMIESFNNMMSALEESYNQQKQFVEDASHELRTPLQIIQGHLQLINRWGRNSPEVLDESLGISIEELKRINKLVEELLLLTKNEGEGSLLNEYINLNDEITSRLDSLDKVHPDYTFEAKLEQGRVMYPINNYHFEQMLIIFLDNAIKFDTENKHITVSSETADDGSIEIQITDSGIGIPKEEIDQVFNRFYRVDKSRSRDQGGNGLGLSIAKKIVELYRGTVWISSAEGESTTVHIKFPKPKK
ncbi:Signal transduction histidine-protein kinase ArlS [Jeotgalicoccus aerolatus]|uniref:histidine kinase n=1 Tax=Jeotgalicoccus aerolatus TaxID=709510 RepID=A0A1G8V2G2_9STAP|nr:HAMP domain-containing histidine kinase [Jeotgalicoccus aerolatus]MBP1951835.1 two-component system sensor histidine kinase ArlS [Jeotgalicoccus aerolatus]NMA81980.1 HAMP domain-containing histidine kinase [Jeotgalicoccus aerolatus]CAD2075011.1 Signal transduction histidine-protein kinase ArlS [Jeotgalicoccus aerolatus]SDJ60221.1 two-component system, OmpR family, sensor histidine kinase ArlS [Jeotgalicoccus aerolatus]GGD94410.1 signal transduction histidine-protein kinase ArlS [Jeotgalicoc